VQCRLFGGQALLGVLMAECYVHRENRMKRPSGILLFLLPVLLAACIARAAHAQELVISDEYIIQRRPARPHEASAADNRAYSSKSISKFFEVISLVDRVDAQSTEPRTSNLDRAKVERDCARIRQDATVLTCEPNVLRHLHAVPNDPNFSSQWALNNSINTDINAPEAWNYGTGTKSTLIGVIDSGVYGAHPGISTNLWSNPSDAADGQDNDGNGYADDVFGVNTHFGDADPSDCVGHGTHVSGIIGAVGNNGVGVAGVNWSTSLIVASISMDCSGSASVASVIRAYDYFTDLKKRGHNIRVVNASFGGTQFSSAEHSAIDRLRQADIIVVASAGNSNANSDETPTFPANYNLANVISVGATGPTKQRAGYSNFGQSVHIAAPGGDSDYQGGAIYGLWSPLATGGLQYRSVEGTSMAAPMVTGAIGLLASIQPSLTAAALKRMLFDSAAVVPELATAVSGGRFLDLSALVQASVPTDNCPSDPLKVEAGVCGCGIADTDGNNNKKWDCVEAGVVEAVPTKASLKVVGRKIVVTMQERAGVEYYLEVVSSSTLKAGKKRTRTAYLVSQRSAGTIAKPAPGTTLKVRYAYRVAGTASDFSYWSPYASLRVKK